jgi:CheY-like chemotaxis protein
MPVSKPVELLVVDDDEIDVMAITRGLREHQVANPITRAEDGIEALEILRGTHGEKRVGWPIIVLLDLNMPRMGGLEFLEEIRSDPALRHLVVFVLTTSDDEDDIAAAYSQNVAGYVTKNNAGEEFVDLIRLLRDYWTLIVLPTEADAE